MGQRPQVGHDPDTRVARAGAFTRSRFAGCSWVGLGLLTAGLMSACGGGSNSAITRITQAADAQVITAAGQTVAARSGLELHVGDEVRTGDDGDVALATGDRKAYLGGQGSYVVRGRSAGVLQRGAFVVDARKGPSLRVSSGPVTANVGRSAVRVERGFAVRIGVLAGRSVTVTGDASNGPGELPVPSLYQVVVAGRGLPGATPLALVDDDAERVVVPDLVGDDIQLTRTAAALDTGTEGRAIVQLAAASGITTRGPRRALSEVALPIAIARAVAPSSDRAALDSDYTKAADLRATGGSWGVVARLVGTDATATSRAIDTLLAGVPSTGAILAAAPGTGGAASVTGTVTGTGNQPSSTARSNRSNNGGGQNNSGGSNPPSSNPTTRPSPTPSPGPVQQVVDGVLGILPPLSSPAAKPSPADCKLLHLLSC